MTSASDRDPLFHTRKMRLRCDDLIAHIREDIEAVDDPQFRAMFETAAEVLGGLSKAFSGYEQTHATTPPGEG